MSNIAQYQASANASNTELIGGDQFDQWLRVYNHTGGTVTNGYVYALACEVDATDTDNPIFKMTIGTPATEADMSQNVVVVDDPAGTITNHNYGLVKIRGYIKAYCVGTTDIAAGDGLGAINGVTNLQRVSAASAVDDQLEAEVCAIAMEAYTTDTTPALKKVMLLGKQCAIAASAS